MSPERIQGSSYSYDSDMWSFGITFLELATGSFPYPHERGGRRLSFWDLLDAIVESPPPTPPAHFTTRFHDFISACLRKEPSARVSSSQLLAHPLLSSCAAVDITAWLRAALAKVPPPGSAEEDGPHDAWPGTEMLPDVVGGTQQLGSTWSGTGRGDDDDFMADA
jgi:mitogen-activated protein kinase kinase 1